MANNYLQFSEIIPCRNTEEQEWLLAKLEEVNDPDREDWEGGIARYEADPAGVWVHADEYGNPDALCAVVAEFQQHFKITTPWFMSYATTCSKPRLGEFGGGAACVLNGKAYFCDPITALVEKLGISAQEETPC